MSSPLQLSVPDGAQIHIHFGPPLQPGGLPPPAAATVPEPPRIRPLRLGIAALLVFGAGYGLRGLSSPSANAQDQLVTSLSPAPIPALPGSPAGAVLGSAPGMPSSIQVNPLPLPPGVLASQYSGQPPAGYANPVPLFRPGMAVRAPYPALPATLPGPGATAVTPSSARNPFGLE